MKRIEFTREVQKMCRVPARYRACVEHIEMIEGTEMRYERGFVDRLVEKFLEAVEDVEILKRMLREKEERKNKGIMRVGCSPGRSSLLRMEEDCIGMYAHILTLYSLVEEMEAEILLDLKRDQKEIFP
jgi:hypothetical protein